TSEIFICKLSSMAISRERFFISSSLSLHFCQISISFWDAFRYILGSSVFLKSSFFLFIWTLTSSPVSVTMPTSCPDCACVATTSPMERERFPSFLKNSFLLFLKRTSTQSNRSSPLGNDILESQSKTVSLLQPSVPQVPLFLQPRGCPPLPVEQLLQPIFNIL